MKRDLYNPMLALDSLAHYSQDWSNPGPEIKLWLFKNAFCHFLRPESPAG